MRDLIFTEHTCARCGKKFQAHGTPVPGMNCKECTEFMLGLNTIRNNWLISFVKDKKILTPVELVMALSREINSNQPAKPKNELEILRERVIRKFRL